MQVPKSPLPQSIHDIQQSSLYGNVKKKNNNKKPHTHFEGMYLLSNGRVISLCFRYEAQTSEFKLCKA